MYRLTLRIEGRVQGVGFRWFVRTEAERLGLKGCVRNLPDGSVEVVSEGSKESLAELESRCRQGPRAAQVGQVDRGLESVTDRHYTQFEIR